MNRLFSDMSTAELRTELEQWKMRQKDAPSLVERLIAAEHCKSISDYMFQRQMEKRGGRS